MLDTPFNLDHELANRTIASAEALSIFFPWFGRALIVDTRHRDGVPPAIYTDGMVASGAERLRSIVAARPQFARPPRLMAIPWPGGTGSFVDSGAYEAIVRRFYALGFGRLERDCERALADLRRAERRVKLAYIRGDHCKTVYQRPRWAT
jgi:hypothetical protein